MKIALDAMGGDHAPEEIVRGAILAVKNAFVQAEDLILCGDKARIENIISAAQAEDLGFLIEHAPETIEMHESPVEALRKKKGASVLRCVELVAAKKSTALVSMGNTGAAVAASSLGLRMLEGIRRPGIAVTLPADHGPVTVIDVGANIKCKPIHLFHYGLMAAQYAQDTLKIKTPRIGLLNIGEEEEKGNTLVKETLELFRHSELNFIGNIEGQDIFRDVCDVVVCEGFVGNVVLKVSEGLAGFMLSALKKSLVSAGKEELAELFKSFQKKVDYAEYGGAILLGVDGIVIIGHGRSDAKAVASALKLALNFTKAQVNRHILADLQRAANTKASQ